jgi:hypothetical protein
VYNAPACVSNGNLTIAGLSVTGNGFGTWKYSFTVTGSACTKAAPGASSGQAAVGKGQGAAKNGTSGRP